MIRIPEEAGAEGTLMTEALRILVIDDDPVMRELLEALLGLAGHAVTTAESGEEALEHLARERVDVVLTDMHMRGLHGEELARALKRVRTPGMLLIGMSGSSPTRAEMQVLDYFLQKPFTPEQFLAALDTARAEQPRGEAASAVRVEGDGAGSRPVLDDNVFARLAASIPATQLRELYDLTLEDVGSRLERMQASLEQGDLATVRSEAHAIKGSCGMVGATELYALAASAERGTDAGTLPLADFPAACERLKRMLNGRFNPAA